LHTHHRKSLRVTDIVERWMRDHQIDVSSEFAAVSEIKLYACRHCFLNFFKPESVAGSPALYERLGQSTTYYPSDKWEHRFALQDIDGTGNGVEIGCGSGAFVSLVCANRAIRFEGWEQNSIAVAEAQSRGLPVRMENLESAASQLRGHYEVVCAFQVLEHVTSPRSFLENCCQLLRRGGRLIIGVPNQDSFIKHAYNLFDLPPHHMTRWNHRALYRLQRFFPLRLLRLADEPLPPHKVAWFVETYEAILRKYRLGCLIHPWVRSRTIHLLESPAIGRLVRGDTVYASYVRE
jgi:SAM-dependent methyltransferase